METSDSASLFVKTRSRTLEPIMKSGYMDGAAGGQASVFQQSFDLGYEQGLSFGLQLGITNALVKFSSETKTSENMQNINCQVCVDRTYLQQNVTNLSNTQKEKNEEYFKKIPFHNSMLT